MSDEPTETTTDLAPTFADESAELADRIADAEQRGRWDVAMTLKQRQGWEAAKHEPAAPTPEERPAAFQPRSVEELKRTEHAAAEVIPPSQQTEEEDEEEDRSTPLDPWLKWWQDNREESGVDSPWWQSDA